MVHGCDVLLLQAIYNRLLEWRGLLMEIRKTRLFVPSPDTKMKILLRGS
jgi:hypothetical protein